MKTIIRLAGIMILLWAAGLAGNAQESQGDQEERARKKAQAEKARGMKMLEVESMGLTVEEEENVIQVEVEEGKRAVDLLIQVPFSTSLRLSCRDDERGVTVQGVNGEIEVDTSDGPIVLTDVSGPVVADSSDGGIKAVFGEVTPGKPMSFSSMDGDIEITLPLDVKASLKMKTDEGQILTELDVQITPTRQKK